MGFIKEFRDFAVKGNVLDMAVGIIIGGAFGKIVSSFVSDVVMPPIGFLLGGVDFKDLKVVIKDAQPAVMDGATKLSDATTEVALNYGAFINTIIDFTIIAFAVFTMVKAVNYAKKKEEQKPAPAAEPLKPSNQEILLSEIRDLLKNK
jgi:large conductance mechanosensitive channel